MSATRANLAPVGALNIIRHQLTDDGTFPNNDRLPLLIFRNAVTEIDPHALKKLLRRNRWGNEWEDGIYDYHHYHSTAHEVLIVLEGGARLQFGGPNGVTEECSVGDTVIIPAGVAHKCLEAKEKFKVLGAYPRGQDYDILQGKTGERPKADKNIKGVKLREADPLYGESGPLMKNWV